MAEFIINFTTRGRGYSIVSAANEEMARIKFDKGMYDNAEQEEWSIEEVIGIKSND